MRSPNVELCFFEEERLPVKVRLVNDVVMIECYLIIHLYKIA